MFVIGGLLFAGVFLWVDMQGAAAVVFALGVGLQSIPARFTNPPLKNERGMTREDAVKWLRRSGHLGATHEVIEDERETHNKNSRSGAIWSNADWYKDYDGRIRDVTTDELR